MHQHSRFGRSSGRHPTLLWAAVIAGAFLVACAEDSGPFVEAGDPIAAGRYLITVGNCNDCHTDGYMEADGKLPEEVWLTGSPLGWRGPWGTTYASNLRLVVQDLSEDEFVEMVHTRAAMPPMPWMNLNRISERDARAVYRYIRSLGPQGERMPRPLPPDVEPATPYVWLMPQDAAGAKAEAP